MERYLRLLRDDMDNASTNTRLFLIRYLRVYGLEARSLTIKDLVRDLGIHDKGVRTAITFLVENQYLWVDGNDGGGRGRPRRVLRAGKQLMAIFDEPIPKGGEIIHLGLIEHLLSRQEPRSNSANSDAVVRLKNSEKLLMAVLYAHADQDGWVVDIGFSELSNFTGLTHSQLRAHIRTLKSLQLITVYEPGGLVRKGVKKIKSRFLLKLSATSNGKIRFFKVEVTAVDHFARSALLAYALLVVKGASFASKVANALTPITLTEKEIEYWLSIYTVDGDWFVDLWKCLRFFAGRDIHGRKLEDMYALLCDIVADLLMLEKDKRSLEEINALLRGHAGLVRYVRALTNKEYDSLIRFFSKVIKALLAEIEPQLEKVFGRFDQCSVRILERDTMEICYKVKSDDQDQE